MTGNARQLVLVVEDEPLVRHIAQLMLESAGFAVVAAGDAQQAIDCLAIQPAVCLIVSDVQMPGALDGLGLIKHLRQDGVLIPAILTSGRLEPLALPHGTSFLPKPYTMPKLLGAVHAFLPRQVVS